MPSPLGGPPLGLAFPARWPLLCACGMCLATRGSPARHVWGIQGIDGFQGIADATRIALPEDQAGGRPADGAGPRAQVQQVTDVVVVDLQELALHLPTAHASIVSALLERGTRASTACAESCIDRRCV